jgi:hypothetical protein
MLGVKTRSMGVQSQQRLTWLKHLTTRVCVLSQQVLRGEVHPSVHSNCCKQPRGEQGSVGNTLGFRVCMHPNEIVWCM